MEVDLGNHIFGLLFPIVPLLYPFFCYRSSVVTEYRLRFRLACTLAVAICHRAPIFRVLICLSQAMLSHVSV
jgi:hypothetical protein